MLAKRVLVAAILLPVGLTLVVRGGVIFATFIVLIMLLAAWEYNQLFRAGGLRPSGVLVLGGTFLFVAGRAMDGFASAPWIISLLGLVSMTYHLVDYERGRDHAGTDFAVTLAGPLYIGWVGAYLISLRDLPDGLWWFLLALPTVWLADSAAYLIGSRWGRHKLSRRLSPKKSWEGYIAGVVVGALSGVLLGAIWQSMAGPGTSISPLRGLILGLILSLLSTLGDLGESMFKRQVDVKDSGNLLPGHGGVFDRIDSWLWASIIGYYVVLWFFLR